MLVPMTKVRIMGRRGRLEEVLERLYGLRLVELEDVGSELALDPMPGAGERALRREELRLLVAEIDALLALRATDAVEDVEADAVEDVEAEVQEVDPVAVRAELRGVAPRVEGLTGRVEGLFAEEVVLGRYVGLLRDLLAAVPELRLLGPEFAALHLGTTVLVLSADDGAGSIIALLREELRALVGECFVLMSATIESAVGCVLIYPLDTAADVQELLGRRRVRQLPLPDAYRDLSLSASLEAMEERLREIPSEIGSVRAELHGVLRPHVDGWRRARVALVTQLEQIDAVRWVGATDRVFVVSAWVPRPDVPRLGAGLRRLGEDVVLEEVAASRRDTSAPVLLRNPRPARPFEFLVRFYDDPRARSVDPTGLLVVFVPLMFGFMVGDIVYGVLLLAAALLAGRVFSTLSPIVRDGLRVLVAGALWAIVFGVVFGEALGDLGERALDLPALWRHRDDADALEALLLLALALGTVHVTLGYVLGLWQSRRDRAPRSALTPLGSLVMLAALLAAAAVAADRLPVSALGPAAAVALVGLVLVSAPHGALGLVLGPLELFGLVANLLSYLRLAAVGLASVFLAVVANELAVAGPLWIGVVVAILLHALNLVLAGFTPAIQALRLQYVEFFSKFFLGGGRAFRPFGARETPSAPASGTPVRLGA